jgi:hypothetical protein
MWSTAKRPPRCRSNRTQNRRQDKADNSIALASKNHRPLPRRHGRPGGWWSQDEDNVAEGRAKRRGRWPSAMSSSALTPCLHDRSRKQGQRQGQGRPLPCAVHKRQGKNSLAASRTERHRAPHLLPLATTAGRRKMREPSSNPGREEGGLRFIQRCGSRRRQPPPQPEELEDADEQPWIPDPSHNSGGCPPPPPAGYSSERGSGEPRSLSHDSQSSWGEGRGRMISEQRDRLAYLSESHIGSERLGPSIRP